MTCACGQPATVKFYVHFRYPRARPEPMAWDPYYVIGGGFSIQACGNLPCAGAMASWHARRKILDHLTYLGPGLDPLNPEQLAGVTLWLESDQP